MTGKVFLNYRRSDADAWADRLFERLVGQFSRENIFMDINGDIPVGFPWAEWLDSQVAACDLMLVLIGRSWVAELAARSDERDFVRVEVESALKRKIPVVPVLLEDTPMPKDTNVPETIRPLLSLQAARLQRRSFDGDTERLANDIRNSITLARGQAGVRSAPRQVDATVMRYRNNPKPVRLGNVTIDRVFLMIGNHTEPAEISIRYNGSRLNIPTDIRPLYVSLADRAKQRAKEKKQPYFNGPNTRLLCISQEKARQLESGQEGKGWVLEVGPVSWEEHTVLNTFLDEEVLAGGDTIRHRFADENMLYQMSPDLRWCQLSTILTVAMIPITTDGYGLIQHRSPTGVNVGGNTYTSGVAENMHRYLDEAPEHNLSYRANALTEASSTPVDHHYQPRGVPSPLLTAQRGVLEELSEGLYDVMEGSPERFKFLNVVLALDTFNPHLVGVIEMPLTRAEVEKHIQESPGKDHSEFTTIEYLLLSPDDRKTAEFLADQSRWTISGLSAFITSVSYWRRVAQR